MMMAQFPGEFQALFSFQPAGVPDAMPLFADISADLPCLLVLEGDPTVFRHAGKHLFLPLLWAGEINAEAVAGLIDILKDSFVDIVFRKDQSIAYQPVSRNGEPAGMKDRPLLTGAQMVERNRLLDTSFCVEVPDRSVMTRSEIHGPGTPGIVVGHDGFPILGRLNDGVDSHVTEIIPIVSDGI